MNCMSCGKPAHIERVGQGIKVQKAHCKHCLDSIKRFGVMADRKDYGRHRTSSREVSALAQVSSKKGEITS